MVKSRAEISRDYRKRLKEKDNDQYLRKERERRKKSYIPSGLLSRKDRAERNKKNNVTLRRHRLRKKQALQELRENVAAPNDDDAASTSGYESISSASHMVVAMPFPNRRNGPKKRINRSLSKAYRKITELKKSRDKLMKKLRSAKKRNQRLTKKFHSSPKTPKSKAESLMKKAKLSNAQKAIVRKQLVYGNAVTEQIAQSKNETENLHEIGIVHTMVAGKVTKKYRCMRWLSKETGLSRNTMAKCKRKSLSENLKQQRSRVIRKVEKKVVSFLERDDNSRAQPGKADTKRGKDGEKKQTRILTDYLGNLHQKFLGENPEMKLSFASFCRIRPSHVLLTSFISRSTCLCTKHQNMALTLKAMRKAGVTTPSNPESYLKEPVKSNSVREVIGNNQEISVGQWKRIEVEERGKMKNVMKIVQSEMSINDFIDHLEKQTKDFEEHVDRMKTQYEQIRYLKQNLPNHEIIIHMDFAENYSCR